MPIGKRCSVGASARSVRTVLPTALIIHKKGQLSYAEILNKVKQDTTLQQVGQSITKIRRTMAGDIILVLDKVSQEKTAQLYTAIGSATRL